VRRARLGLGLLACALAFGADAQGVRELAFAWVQGDFRAPLTCTVDGAARQALRRVRVNPGPREAARPTQRLTFHDLEAPPGTRCASISGQPEPNVAGTLDLVWDARTRPDTGEVDFRNTLRREGGFAFKVESGSLRVGPSEAGKAGERVIDFAGGTARFERVVPGSDAARRTAGFGAHRQLVLRVEAPGQSALAFDLIELSPH
jgi:hypothetical protein